MYKFKVMVKENNTISWSWRVLFTHSPEPKYIYFSIIDDEEKQKTSPLK